METDGGGALVLASADRAQATAAGRPLALVRAAAQSGPGVGVPAKRGAERLFDMAGLGRADIDVVQIYDHFCPFVLFALEDYGFVKDAGRLAVGRRHRMGRRRRASEHLAAGTFRRRTLQGMNHLIEAVRQVRGESTAQVPNATFSFCDTGIGAGAVIFERFET